MDTGNDLPSMTFIGALVALVTAILGGVIHWWRGNRDDAAKLRDDLMKIIDEQRADIKHLRERIDRLEDELLAKTKQILNYEISIARIKHTVLTKHGIDIDAMVGDEPKPN